MGSPKTVKHFETKVKYKEGVSVFVCLIGIILGINFMSNFMESTPYNGVTFGSYLPN